MAYKALKGLLRPSKGPYKAFQGLSRSLHHFKTRPAAGGGGGGDNGGSGGDSGDDGPGQVQKGP